LRDEKVRPNPVDQQDDVGQREQPDRGAAEAVGELMVARIRPDRALARNLVFQGTASLAESHSA